MSYKVIVDSCGEFTEEMKESGGFETAFSEYVSRRHESGQMMRALTRKSFLRRVAASPECPKSSCPSPEEYMESYHCEAEQGLCGDSVGGIERIL